MREGNGHHPSTLAALPLAVLACSSRFLDHILEQATCLLAYLCQSCESVAGPSTIASDPLTSFTSLYEASRRRFRKSADPLQEQHCYLILSPYPPRHLVATLTAFAPRPHTLRFPFEPFAG